MKVSYEIQDFKLIWEHDKIACPEKRMIISINTLLAFKNAREIRNSSSELVLFSL